MSKGKNKIKREENSLNYMEEKKKTLNVSIPDLLSVQSRGFLFYRLQKYFLVL
jgi:hypothetical protein